MNTPVTPSTPSAAVDQSRPIVVIGSLNMDLVMRAERMPVAGETLHGNEFLCAPGGKGANQALACSRLGGSVAMVGRIGDDSFGETLRAGLAESGINHRYVQKTAATSTGVAIILVEEALGQNRIVLSSGANAELSPADIDAAGELIDRATRIVLQLEIPLATVAHVLHRAQAAGVPVLLNPAPAKTLPDEFWPLIDILVPNESEAALLTGKSITDIASASLCAQELQQRGVRCVMITLGAQGLVIADENGTRHLPAQPVSAVDTTAAGDTFIGGLVAGCQEGLSLDAACQLGQQASALCVTRQGAQPSIPYRHEIS